MSRWRSNATWRGPNATWRALLAPFWAVLAPWRRSHVALELQRDMAGPNTTWRTLFALFWAVLVPLRWSHVVLEAQRDMAGAQYDVALAFGSLLGCFGAFGMEPRRVGGPTRHGALPIRRDARFWLLFGLFWCLWDGATSRWRSNATWRGPSQSCTAFFWALQQKKPPPN